jgi:hypothetical protein
MVKLKEFWMVIYTSNLTEYFKEILENALQKTNIKLTNQTQNYIINLLDEFTRVEIAFSGNINNNEESTATLWLRAIESDKKESIRILRHVGDSSLYFIGFFKDNLENKLVGSEYYSKVGQSAYASVAGMTKEENIALLYNELATHFKGLVTVLNAMSFYGEKYNSKQNIPADYLIKLIDRYKRTQNPNLLELLKLQGFCLGPKDEQ